MRINNNLMAMNTLRQLGVNTEMGQKSIEKLSSGLRINRAGDDAAGLAISEKMRGQIRGLNMASKNAQDGISLIQTAEGALNETHAILQRMRELAVQSANDTNVVDDRDEIQKEINQLANEINRIAGDTEYNTQKLLNGEFEAIFHVGANAQQKVKLDISKMDAHQLGLVDSVVDGDGGEEGAKASGTLEGVEFEAKTAGAAGNDIEIVFVDPAGNEQSLDVSVDGNTITVTLATDDEGNITSTAADIVTKINEDGDASALVTASGDGTDAVVAGNVTLKDGADAGSGNTEEVTGINVSSQATADAAITTINDAITVVSAERSKLGAMQNRLEHTIKNLDTSAENLQAAESRIRDIDMAKEIMEFTKNNILQQAATAMLAQANQAPTGVLQLLR